MLCQHLKSLIKSFLILCLLVIYDKEILSIWKCGNQGIRGPATEKCLWFRTVVYAQHQVLTRYIWKIRFHKEGLVCALQVFAAFYFTVISFSAENGRCALHFIHFNQPGVSTQEKRVYRSVGQNHFVGEMCVFRHLFCKTSEIDFLSNVFSTKFVNTHTK